MKSLLSSPEQGSLLAVAGAGAMNVQSSSIVPWRSVSVDDDMSLHLQTLPDPFIAGLCTKHNRHGLRLTTALVRVGVGLGGTGWPVLLA